MKVLKAAHKREIEKVMGSAICFSDTDPLNTKTNTVVSHGIKHDNPVTEALANRVIPKYRYMMTHSIEMLWRIKIVSVFDHDNGEKELYQESEIVGFGVLDSLNEAAIENIKGDIEAGLENKLNKYIRTFYFCEFLSFRNKERTLDEKLKEAISAA